MLHSELCCISCECSCRGRPSLGHATDMECGRVWLPQVGPGGRHSSSCRGSCRGIGDLKQWAWGMCPNYSKATELENWNLRTGCMGWVVCNVSLRPEPMPCNGAWVHGISQPCANSCSCPGLELADHHVDDMCSRGGSRGGSHFVLIWVLVWFIFVALSHTTLIPLLMRSQHCNVVHVPIQMYI